MACCDEKDLSCSCYENAMTDYSTVFVVGASEDQGHGLFVRYPGFGLGRNVVRYE